MSIIWCTAGVSGIDAPAMRASFGLQTPQAMTTISVSMSPPVVRTRADASALDVDAEHLGVREHREPRRRSWPRSRMIVPARSESTTPTDGE